MHASHETNASGCYNSSWSIEIVNPSRNRFVIGGDNCDFKYEIYIEIKNNN